MVRLNRVMLKRIRALMIELQGRIDRGEMAYNGSWGGDGAKPAFDMGLYTGHEPEGYQGRLIGWSEAAECGTVGCAIGWCSLMLTPKLESENLWSYMRRLVFVGSVDHKAVECGLVWEWLFQTDWSRIGGKPQDFVMRLDWLLANGLAALREKVSLVGVQGLWSRISIDVVDHWIRG